MRAKTTFAFDLFNFIYTIHQSMVMTLYFLTGLNVDTIIFLYFTCVEVPQIFVWHLWLHHLCLTLWCSSKSEHFEGTSTNYSFLIQSFSFLSYQDCCGGNQQKILASENLFLVFPLKDQWWHFNIIFHV